MPNEQVNSNFKVNIAVDAPAGVDWVHITIGNTTVNAAGSGTSYTANFTNVPSGSQTIKAEVKDKKSQTKTDQITVTVK